MPSAFRKQRVEGAVQVGTLGLAGDEQADLRVHGGPEKAVYAYAAAHYAAWTDEYPEHREQFVPGGFGENLTVAGMMERDLCVGDVHRIGSALLQVCQPRQPCFKLALFFADPRMLRAMVRSGRAGWYYQVVEGGEIRAGDEVQLDQRPNPEFPFDRLVEIANFGKASVDELQAMAEMTGLASGMRTRASSALIGFQA